MGSRRAALIAGNMPKIRPTEAAKPKLMADLLAALERPEVRQLGDRFRKERPALEALLGAVASQVALGPPSGRLALPRRPAPALPLAIAGGAGGRLQVMELHSSTSSTSTGRMKNNDK